MGICGLICASLVAHDMKKFEYHCFSYSLQSVTHQRGIKWNEITFFLILFYFILQNG